MVGITQMEVEYMAAEVTAVITIMTVVLYSVAVQSLINLLHSSLLPTVVQVEVLVEAVLVDILVVEASLVVVIAVELTVVIDNF